MNDVFLCGQAQRILCSLLGRVLFHIDNIPEEEIDWQAVYEEARAQAVVLTAFSDMRKLPIPEPLASEIKKVLRQYGAGTVQNYAAHSYLNELLGKNHISYCVLKGAASAAYYPESMIRQMGDVDFLIAENDVERAAKILEEDNFQPWKDNSVKQWKERHAHHIVFCKENAYYEMHFSPSGVPEGKAGEAVRAALKDIFSTAVKFEEEPFACMVPDAFHHALVVLLHMQSHLLSEGIGLRHLCDWAVFVNAFEGETFEAQFKEKLRETGLWTFARAMSMTAHVAIGLPYKQWMGEDEELARELLNDILSGGNFGVKDSQRLWEGMFISKDGIGGHHRIQQLFRNMNQLVYRYWPVFGKLKLLLPFGWIFLFVRRWVRTLKGTRVKVQAVDAYRKSAQRKELYGKLKLFEKQEIEK